MTTLRVAVLRVARLVVLRGVVRTAANSNEGSSYLDRRLNRLLEKLKTLYFGDKISEVRELENCHLCGGERIELDTGPIDEPVGFVDIIHRPTNCM